MVKKKHTQTVWLTQNIVKYVILMKLIFVDLNYMQMQ